MQDLYENLQGHNLITRMTDHFMHDQVFGVPEIVLSESDSTQAFARRCRIVAA
jgi:hypothetical protein